VPNQIPQTRVTLKGYVKLQAFAGGLFLDPTRDPSAQIAENQASGGLITIGAANKMEFNEIREENGYYRQFVTDETATHPENAAKPAETFPGLLKYEVHLSRVDMYDSNLLEAFRVGLGQDGHLITQYKPLILFATQIVPDITISNSPTGNPAKTLEQRVYTAIGVWFGSIPRVFDIQDTNQSFVQEVDGIAADIF